jgi:hypothetical protein
LPRLAGAIQEDIDMLAKGFLWALLARGVTRRLGWLPLILVIGRMFRRRPPGARRAGRRR